MSGTAIALVIIAAVVVVALIAFAVWRAQRTRTLRGRFGPEYDRAIDGADNRREAERDLRERAQRRDELDIRDLTPAAASRYQNEWATVQQRFFDAPAQAVHDAQTLVTTVMRERGYPTGSADEREDMLSVDHSEVMDSYRAATAVEQRSQAGKATTEDLRQAMQHYRTLFDRLLGDALTSNEGTYPAGTTGTRNSRDVVDVTEREDADKRL